jgi:O-succinylbenzoate synthase
MKVDSVDIYHVAMPLKEPWRTAYGEDSTVESVLVRMQSHDGYGWGESSPLRAPTYSSEWAHGVFLTIRDWLAPALVGKDVESGEDLQQLLAWVKGNYFAKAALDLAWWDLKAKAKDKPLWKLIGGRSETVNVGADIGVMPTLSSLLSATEKALTAGFRRIKLKFRPGWDVPVIAAVREHYPAATVHIDCNAAYTLRDQAVFHELERFGLAMIEQPLAHDDLVDHAKLQSMISTPVCLDESIVSLEKTRKAIELSACSWINIKPGRVGGLTNAIAIHDLCEQAGIPCWVGGMLESGIGQAHNIALATLSNIRYPSDIFPSTRFFERDLAEPDIILSGPSQIEASSEPGIGREPNPELLQEHLVATATVR